MNTPPGALLRAIGYARVSSEDQVRGVSLDAQRATLLKYADLHADELALVEVIVDAGLSGKTLERPGLRRALGMIETGEAGALVVVKLDRLTRSVADLATLLDRHFGPNGAALHSVSERIDTGSAAGRMMLNIIGALGQWERETLVERTVAAMRHKKARGERVGSVPYGYRVGPDGKALLPDAAERATIARARELHAEGLSLRRISAALAADGHHTRAGKPFAPGQLARLLPATPASPLGAIPAPAPRRGQYG